MLNMWEHIFLQCNLKDKIKYLRLLTLFMGNTIQVLSKVLNLIIVLIWCNNEETWKIKFSCKDWFQEVLCTFTNIRFLKIIYNRDPITGHNITKVLVFNIWMPLTFLIWFVIRWERLTHKLNKFHKKIKKWKKWKVKRT